LFLERFGTPEDPGRFLAEISGSSANGKNSLLDAPPLVEPLQNDSEGHIVARLKEP
jgi:hypothetical protein